MHRDRDNHGSPEAEDYVWYDQTDGDIRGRELTIPQEKAYDIVEEAERETSGVGESSGSFKSLGDTDERILSGELEDGTEYEFIHYHLRSPYKVVGELKISPPVDPVKVETPGFVSPTHINPGWSSGSVRLCITDGDETRGSIQLVSEDREIEIPFLSSRAYYSVALVLSGEVEGAKYLIRRSYSSKPEWRFRDDCVESMPFERFVEVLDRLARFEQPFSHMQFRYAMGYFAKRIGDESLHGIHRFNTLEERIKYWNEFDGLRSVTVPEVIGEKLGRRWHKEGEVSDERRELVDIGFSPSEYDPEWETLVPACWISHIVLSEGEDEAMRYVCSRPVSSDMEYKEAKSTAFKADRDRGEAWGEVLPLTVRFSPDEFAFDTHNYLYWTARDYPYKDKYEGKANLECLLFAGARELCPEHMRTKHKQDIEFREKVSAGHSWRRYGAIEKEVEAFKQARKIASGENSDEYDMNPRHLTVAESSIAHAEAKAARRNGDATDAVTCYRDGIERIEQLGREHHVPDWVFEREIDFLEEQVGRVQTKSSP